MTKRMLCIVMTLLLLLSVLSACNKQSAQSVQSSAEQASEEGASAPQYAYQAQYYDLPEQLQWIGESCTSGNAMYFIGSTPNEQQTATDENGESYSYNTYIDALFRFDLTTGESEQLTNYVAEPELPALPEGADAADYNTYTNVQTMAAGPDGTIWLFRQTSRYALNGEDELSFSELLQLDAHGTLLRTVTPATPEESEDGSYYPYIDTVLADDKGNVYTYDYQTLNVYGPDGVLLCTVSADKLSGQLCQLSDSEIGVSTTSTDGKHVFQPIDPATGMLGAQTPLADNAWELYPGNDEYRYYFTRNGSVFGERCDTGETEKVIDWLACDVDSNNIYNRDVGFLSDGRIVAILHEESAQRLVVLTRVEAAAVQQKTELRLACFSLDYNLRSQIVKFNRSSSDYRIVVTDYADYATDEDYTAGLTKLNTEILAGNIPDLFASNTSLSTRQYAAKGLLEDLWTYIDADPEFSREAFVQQPLRAAQTGDKLYRLPLDFGVVTAAGLGKVVGEYDTWTPADLTDALQKLPQDASIFGKYMTQDYVLQLCMMMNAESFIDWQTGSCDFESDSFQSLLEFVKLFPAEYDYSSDENNESDFSCMKNGKQLLYMQEIADFDNIYYTFAALDNDVRFVGFPCEDGTSGNVFSSSTSLSISSACKDKSGAWSFVRSTLSDEYQSGQWNLPIIRSAFDAKAAEAMKQDYAMDENGNQLLDENGQPIPISHGGMSWGDDEIIELYAVTQEQYDAVMALIDSATRFADYDTNVMNIISEEAAGFLAGDKSVDEAARLIQSRVNLYIQEQS